MNRLDRANRRLRLKANQLQHETTEDLKNIYFPILTFSGLVTLCTLVPFG